MNKYHYIIILCLLLSLQSCLTPRKTIYVRDMIAGKGYPAITAPALRVQKNDRLAITISAKNPELAAPFNLDIGSYSISREGEVGVTNSKSNNTFLVDQEGRIDYPILGVMDVEGLTLEGVRDLIWENLVNKKLIASPIVKVELINLKITMMGEVGAVGVLNVPDTRITLLDAIAQSGGLTPNAVPDRVTVIREEAGERKLYLNNIQSTDIFNSPTYYLQQNDIVYVHPRGGRLSEKENNTMQLIGLITGFLGLGLTLLVLITR